MYLYVIVLFFTELDECIHLSPCGLGQTCVNTIGSYFCLPSISSVVAPASLSSMSGGDHIQITVTFEPNTSFSVDTSIVNSLYSLNVRYGAFDMIADEVHTVFTGDNIQMVYDPIIEELSLNFTTTSGLIDYLFVKILII